MELDLLPLDTIIVYLVSRRELESRDSLQFRINYNLILSDNREREIKRERERDKNKLQKDKRERGGAGE